MFREHFQLVVYKMKIGMFALDNAQERFGLFLQAISSLLFGYVQFYWATSITIYEFLLLCYFSLSTRVLMALLLLVFVVQKNDRNITRRKETKLIFFRFFSFWNCEYNLYSWNALSLFQSFFSSFVHLTEAGIPVCICTSITKCDFWSFFFFSRLMPISCVFFCTEDTLWVHKMSIEISIVLYFGWWDTNIFMCSFSFSLLISLILTQKNQVKL